MIENVRALIQRLPIVQMLLQHRDERCEAECEKQALKEQQHDLARRLHVIEWLTYPHRDKDQT